LPALRRVVEQVRLACQVTAPVLLVGDPGTGKDWLARTIHYQGAGREGAFAALDCRRLPAPAVAHVLFREGPAGQGLTTVYLDEPACLPREMQARLHEWLTDAPAPVSPERRGAGSPARGRPAGQ